MNCDNAKKENKGYNEKQKQGNIQIIESINDNFEEEVAKA